MQGSRPTLAKPPRYKLAMVTWLGIYPLMTTLAAFLGPFLFGNLPVYCATLVLTGIAVPLMTYVIMPFLLRVFGDWLHR